MSLSVDPTIRQLNNCHACEGLEMETPQQIENRPGLATIAYRIGTHSRFKATMLARLSAADLPALNALTTRANDDFTIALLDAFAAMADVLTFYQERIANESYMRTATERRSLVELANLIGYVPRPGVAASAYLAFTLEKSGASEEIPVPVGTRVQSIPGPGEKPQTFETIEPLVGRAEWNAIKPLLVQKHPALSADLKELVVRGTAANVQKGDSLLLVWGNTSSERDLRRVIEVRVDSANQKTYIKILADKPDPFPFIFLKLLPAVWNSTPIKLTSTAVKSNVMLGSWKQADLTAYSMVQKWSLPKLSYSLLVQSKLFFKLDLVDKGVFAMRQRAAIFGHNAPKYNTLPATQRFADFVTGADGTLVKKDAPYPDSWENNGLDDEPGAQSSGNAIDLDNTYPTIVKGSWLVLDGLNHRYVYRVEDNTELSRADYTLTAKVSRIKLNSDADFHQFGLRTTSVLAQSEELELAELPITDTIKGNKIPLDGPYLGLVEGMPVVVSGKRTDLDGVEDSEVMFLAEVIMSQGFTELTFVTSLAHEYERTSVRINANVALATHGESKQQAIGSGDTRVPFQKFTLPEAPLTYVPAQNLQGVATTLQVRVNDLLWQEVNFLYGYGPEDHIYATRTDDEGRTLIHFGDGVTGARLPTGQENVRASYRKGMGAEGLVGEGQLSLLQTRPLGVRGVINPLAAGDAASAESRDDVRRNAPLPIRSLNRIVSLRDYEDFARAFPGIAKALATWTWNGYHQGVFVTVGGEGGKVILEDSLTYKNLLSAILQAGDATLPLRVKSYTPAFFTLAANLSIDPAYLPEKVLAAVESALRAAFSFEARSFGQPVAKSEVIATIQSTKGVLALDLNELYRVDAAAEIEETGIKLYDILTAQSPRSGSNNSVGAELLLLDPRPVALGSMSV